MRKITQEERENLLNGNWKEKIPKTTVKTISIQTGIYRHFKGKLYEVIGVVRDSDDCRKILVHYRQMEESDFPIGTEWVRPVEEFCDVHPCGDKRFVFVKEALP